MLNVNFLNVIMLNVVWLNVNMLSVIMLNVGMLSGIMLCVIMLNVVAPIFHRSCDEKKADAAKATSSSGFFSYQHFLVHTLVS